MENTNVYSHMTLEERRIILKGVTNGSTKTVIAQTIGKEIKADRILVKNVPCIWNAPLIESAPLTGSARLTARITCLSAAPGVTTSLALATATQTAAGVISTDLNTTLKKSVLYFPARCNNYNLYMGDFILQRMRSHCSI